MVFTLILICVCVAGIVGTLIISFIARRHRIRASSDALLEEKILEDFFREKSEKAETLKKPEELGEPKYPYVLSNGFVIPVEYEEGMFLVEGILREIRFIPADKDWDLCMAYAIEGADGIIRQVDKIRGVSFGEEQINKAVWALVKYSHGPDGESPDDWACPNIKYAGIDGIRSGTCPSCGAHLPNIKKHCEYCGTQV